MSEEEREQNRTEQNRQVGRGGRPVLLQMEKIEEREERKQRITEPEMIEQGGRGRETREKDETRRNSLKVPKFEQTTSWRGGKVYEGKPNEGYENR